MANQTNIEWADSTFNPWIGCTKVSPACDHCYAEARMDKRLHVVGWGSGQPRKRTSAKNWKLPLQWNATPFYKCFTCGWRGDNPETKGSIFDGLHSCPECDSVNITRARRRVFCASLADVFDNEVPEQWRYDLWQLINQTPNLDWLLLTKRIGNAKQPEVYRTLSWPHNVWLGATICNQAEADRDIPKLLEVPANVRFLSIEPLLGPIDLTAIPTKNSGHGHHEFSPIITINVLQRASVFAPHVDWVIVGGESGHKARPMHPDWVRGLRDQCESAGVPFLFKQWGEWAPYDRGRTNSAVLVDKTAMDKPLQLFGKKRAGRQLDGVTHTEFPKVAV